MKVLKQSRSSYLFVVTAILTFVALNFNGNYIKDMIDKKQQQNAIAMSQIKVQTSCHKSRLESDDFICEPDDLWQSRRDFYSKQHDRNILTMNEYEKYFSKNWFQEFQCKTEIRIGELDGGKWACDIEYLKSKPSCVVYSLGSGADFTFERKIKEHLPGCSIHTIDEKYTSCPPHVCTFHHVKLGNGQNQTKTLQQLMIDLNHTTLEIDILKVDIEYSEYVLFHTLFSNDNINPKLRPLYIRQILVEVHLQRDRIYETNALFYLFNSQNYVIYHREPNLTVPSFACEFGFLKLNRKFFRGYS